MTNVGNDRVNGVRFIQWLNGEIFGFSLRFFFGMSEDSFKLAKEIPEMDAERPV